MFSLLAPLLIGGLYPAHNEDRILVQRNELPPYLVETLVAVEDRELFSHFGVSPKSIVRRRKDLPEACRLLIETYRQPVLVERFLAGREFTTAVIGTGRQAEVLGTMEVLLLAAAEPQVYSYHNKENFEALVRYRLVQPADDPLVAAVEDIALRAWRVLGCRDAGRLAYFFDTIASLDEPRRRFALGLWTPDAGIRRDRLGAGCRRALGVQRVHPDREHGDVVLDVGAAGAFDARWCVLPCVHRFGERWHLYYTGHEGSDLGLQSFPGIGLAVSEDGLSTARHK